MEYRYYPTGVCSREMIFDIDDGIVKDLITIGGCNGNLKGISSLIKGMKIEDVISRLEGIDCNGRGTSCPDQISKALKEFLNKN
jgi:uncharacterized protein (TIGR03905 family)